MRESHPAPGSAEGTDRSSIAEFPSAAVRLLAAAGLDLFGALAAATYDDLVPSGWRSDRLLPGARSAWVIGSGGQAFARAALAAGGGDPIDRATRHAMSECLRALSSQRASRPTKAGTQISVPWVVRPDSAHRVGCACWCIPRSVRGWLFVPSC
jgi:hypothetical protein